MKQVRIFHAIGTLLTAGGLVALLYGAMRVAVAQIVLATLLQFASLEALRVLATTTAQKVKA